MEEAHLETEKFALESQLGTAAQIDGAALCFADRRLRDRLLHRAAGHDRLHVLA